MKYALIIGNNKYDDSKLAQLKTPAADSQALAKILADTTIGCFDKVNPLINQTETQVRRAISTFLTNKKPDDLVLLYFSGHGVLDDRGRLYLALKDTQVDLLKATSIPSSFIADEMDSCRSKRQVLILDCCHSGAFARGTKGEQKAITETTFEGSGFGRVVLTASDSTQYALEGDQVIKQTELSLFTHFLLEGLKTGEADINNDGRISLDEWYDYTYARVVSETPRQVPHKWSYNEQGDMIIAQNPYAKQKIAELPDELVQALESSFVGIRESAVRELGKYLRSRDPDMVTLAVSFLQKMREDDSRRIAILAEGLLSEFEQAHTPNKAAMPETRTETEPETVRASSMSSKLDTMQPEALTGAGTAQAKIERANPPGEIPDTSRRLILKPSFWFKWIGVAILGLIFLSILFDYDRSLLDDYSVKGYFAIVLFGVMTGALSFLQWLVFRHQLADWWIVVNAATGVILGLGHRYLFLAISDWHHEQLSIFLAIWIIGNFALGPILMRRTGEKSKSPSAIFPVTPASKAETVSPQKIISNWSDWSKWIGTTAATVLLSLMFYSYNQAAETTGGPVPVLLFAAVTGASSLIQWFVFRNRLKLWWVGANLAAGTLLGLLQNYLYEASTNWWSLHLLILLAIWVAANLALGRTLAAETQQGQNDFLSAPPANPGAESARQNIFLMLVSIVLVFFALITFSLLSDLSGLLQVFLILYGIAAILAGASLVLKKEAWRNFGFVSLAIFLFLDGVTTLLYFFNSEYPTYLIRLSVIFSLGSGFYFLFWRQVLKNIGFLMLAGYLISVSVAYFFLADAPLFKTFLVISTIFALPAAVLFFVRK